MMGISSQASPCPSSHLRNGNNNSPCMGAVVRIPLVDTYGIAGAQEAVGGRIAVDRHSL